MLISLYFKQFCEINNGLSKFTLTLRKASYFKMSYSFFENFLL